MVRFAVFFGILLGTGATQVYANGFVERCFSGLSRVVSSSASAQSTFEKVFSDPMVYQSGQCDANIARLLNRLEQHGNDISKAKVHYFTSPGGFYTRESRNPFASWSFHAVLELDGKIYDFDFTRNPRVISVKDYFLENILPEDAVKNPKGLEKFLNYQQSLTLPAKEYAERFPKKKTDKTLWEPFQSWLEEYQWRSLKELYEEFF